ncbi:MAG: MFS transporter [Firmicutes bacterium]|nr:MFS transporter [Bacillota bacterium]MCM1401211.1 MFS transporter [Bacteroides sp.]MCM1477092.1 MFS transporter [Bacteroides sp.]
MSAIKIKLALMNFLEFAVWGAYLVSLGIYLAGAGLGDKIYWFYTVQGIVSIFMPAIIGILADRYIQAQRMLSLCHALAGAFMCAAGAYCMSCGDNLQFGPLFTLYTISVAFFMPTIGLANSVAYTALNKAGLDTVTHFPPIRVFGTVGFIASMLLTNFLPVGGTSMQKTFYQLFSSGIFSFILAAYALTMPSCPVNKGGSASISDALGLKAFTLFKEKKMAIFFIFSMLLGVSLQITNSYGTTFINAFEQVTQYADSWVANNATALISLSQVSETLCILLIPFCLKRFGIKGVMLIAMFGWVFRFGFFGIGNPEMPGVLLFILSCVVYGVAFDFFNISGSLYVDKQTDPSIRSSAQGLFMLMTNGIGATIGTLAAGQVVNHFVYERPEALQIEGWQTSWYIFAAYALVVAILFWIIFRDDTKAQVTKAELENDGTESPDGFVVVDDVAEK